MDKFTCKKTKHTCYFTYLACFNVKYGVSSYLLSDGCSPAQCSFVSDCMCRYGNLYINAMAGNINLDGRKAELPLMRLWQPAAILAHPLHRKRLVLLWIKFPLQSLPKHSDIHFCLLRNRLDLNSVCWLPLYFRFWACLFWYIWESISEKLKNKTLNPNTPADYLQLRGVGVDLS